MRVEGCGIDRRSCHAIALCRCQPLNQLCFSFFFLVCLHCACLFPGGKYTDFEGGVRVAAFASGGIIPSAARGTSSHEIIHICDMWATFSALAGVDMVDRKMKQFGGVPPIDSVDVSPVFTSVNGSSPRAMVVISTSTLILGELHVKVHAGPHSCSVAEFPLLGLLGLATGGEQRGFQTGSQRVAVFNAGASCPGRLVGGEVRGIGRAPSPVCDAAAPPRATTLVTWCSFNLLRVQESTR